MMRKHAALWLLAIAAVASSSCRTYRLEKGLEGEDAAFLSQVRYIITREERKRYLEMPKSDRAAFEDEFWKKRDPDPETEFNEAKAEYLERIAEANRLFSAGRPGWLTDRGRTLIVLGPPINKSFFPNGSPAEGLRYPSEIWYYPTVPVIFIDEGGTGAYQYYFTGLTHQADFMEAMLEARQILASEPKDLFDYELDLKRQDGRDSVIVRIEKPDLWMADEAARVETILEIALELQDQSGQTVWEKALHKLVSLSEDEIARGYPEAEVLTFEVDLPPGKYTLLAWVKNRTDGEARNKTKAVKIARKSTSRRLP